ncbi:MAG: TetR/AcrR family transcriptional regulator [Bacteroidales bacterium]|nr:TetR/AcrR family transcriptional regulator [Bacteroidales bacterium]
MARPITVTKERILSAALDLVRSGGPSALTARSLCARLDCGANAIFSSFGSIQGVRDAVREEARKLYQKRVGEGFALNPPFKGFGIAFIWFAMDEPHLFSMIMESQSQPASYKDYIDSHVGFKAESLSAIADTFGLQGKDAETLYYQLILVALGLASTCTGGKSPLTIQQASEILGKNVRAFLMVIRAGSDEREGFIPNAGGGPGGEVDSYVLKRALMGQNHLLQELRAHPRYIMDEEWIELERMLRNSSDLTPKSLREAHPDLTKGDIRTYILSHLQFSVSEQAILLGISPASVTKARQRLKAKLLTHFQV